VGRQTVVTYIDDLTNKPMERTEARTVHVVVDGWAYPLDISEATFTKHIQPLIKASGPRVRAASVTAGSTAVAARSTSASTGDRADEKARRTATRVWWQRNQGRAGLSSYSERGRIPADVLEAYAKHDNGAYDVTDREHAKSDVQPASGRVAGRNASPEFVSPEPASVPMPVAEVIAKAQRAGIAKRVPATKSAPAKTPAQRGRSAARSAAPSKAPAKVATPAAARGSTARKRA
jgi:hypothetical protein